MNRIMSSALGDEPFDLVLKNVQYVNVYTEEIYPADIGVTDGRIAHVTQPGEDGLDCGVVHDCAGKFAVPGLIDAHMHIESTMMTPVNFARAVIPRGTTAVLADPHEICNVMGVEGMDFCARASADILLRVFLAVPSCVPSVLGAESNKMTFNAEEIGKMLALPQVLSLGEVMDYPGVIRQNPRMMAILEVAKKQGKLIQGHVIDVTPRQLSAYRIAGVESDHESHTMEDAVMKLRAGMVVECRYGSSAQDVPAEAKAVAMLNYPVNAVLCTDDRTPDDLMRIGHLDEAVRQAIANGVPPVKAVQMATRNAALFMGLKDRGGLRAGSLADIVLVRDLREFVADEVFVGGRLCAAGGKLLVDIPAPDAGLAARNTMRVKKNPDRNDFLVTAEGESVGLNAISFVDGDPFFTTLKQVAFPVANGAADIGSVDGYVTMAVIERHNATGNIGLAPAENIGLARGAVAGTVSHDSHNLFVFGKNVDDMVVAARHLIETGGGFAAVEGGRVVGEVRLPLCGLVSEKPMAEISAELDAMSEVVRGMGIQNRAPLHFLTWFCLAVLPEVRLTDMGLIDTVRQRPVSLRV